MQSTGTSMNISELIGMQLDLAVAEALGYGVMQDSVLNGGLMRGYWISGLSSDLNQWTHITNFNPSANWAIGGPIIEREGIYLKSNNDATEWAAGALSKNRYDQKPGPLFYGPTPLIAAMRCFVDSKLLIISTSDYT